MANKRIGFLSYFGWGRGQAYVTLCFCKMLQSFFDIYILKQFNNPIEDEFKSVKVNITEYPNYEVDPTVFKAWVTENKLDAVVFNEYNQWETDKVNLVKLTKSLGVKAYGYLVWEKFGENADYADYDRILVPTKSFCKFMRAHKFRKFSYIPYSIDLQEFPDPATEPFGKKDNSKLTFFHPGGWGGVYNRKNTDVAIRAFIEANLPNSELIITSQKKLEFKNKLPENIKIIDKNLSRKELLKLYYMADLLVMPTKWDTIGISCLTKNTPIFTYNGTKNIQDIKIGDCVLTHDGSFKKVIETMDRNASNIYEIEPKYCNKITLTGNHPVLAIKTTKKNKDIKNYNKICSNKKADWIIVEQLEPYDFIAIPKPKTIVQKKYLYISDYIDNSNIVWKKNKISLTHSYNMKNIKCSGHNLSKKYNISKSVVYRILKGINTNQSEKIVEKIRDKYNNFKVFIPNKIKITKEFCKLIGFYIAEGWSTNSNFGFAFHAKEKKYHRYVLNAIHNIFGINGTIKIEGNKCSVVFSNKIVGQFLQNLCGHLAKNKHVPTELLHIDKSLQKELITGYFNGDGSVYKNRRVSAFTVSKTLAYDIKYLLLRQEILSSVTKTKNRDVYIIRPALSYKTIKLFCLSKKKPRYNFYFEDDNYFYVKLKKISKINEITKVFNLEVETNHTYCGEIIYHNCLESLAAGVPVIGTNIPPVNEFIKDGFNGKLCNGSMVEYPDISVYACEVDYKTLANTMKLCSNDILLSILKKNARKNIEAYYDLEKNKNLFVGFLNYELGE